ncbi:MAG: stage II sporulation protein P [Bacilli bacterium]|nr:stage II sporulation protein P [Bacilli bacterium]
MKKRFIARKRNNFLFLKIISCLLIIYFSCFITIKILFKKKISINDEKRINEYLAVASNNLIGNISVLDLMNMNLSSPETFLKLSFSNFKKLELIEKPKISTKVSKEIKKPLIYIYNTHQTESYNPGNLKEYNITPTVYMASVMLQKTLEKKGIVSVVEETNIKDILNVNNWTYNDSYEASRLLLKDVKSKHPTIKYFIDLHRDSVSSTVTINEKVYAKLMFVIGLSNKNYLENENLVNKLHLNLTKDYKEVMRNIYYAKNGRYNQDLDSNIILIEVGGQDNKIDEVYNSINILAEAIYEEIRGI